MKKLFVLFFLFNATLCVAQNIRPQGSHGARMQMRGQWWYDYTYTDDDSLTVANVKKVTAMIAAAGGGGGGSLTGRSGWYARFTGASAAGIGNLQDTTIGGSVESILYGQYFNLAYQGYNNKWNHYKYTPSTGIVEHKLMSPFGGVGIATTVDSALNKVSMSLVGGSSNRDLEYSGIRNVTGTITGDFQFAAQFISLGNGSGYQFRSRDATSDGWIWYATANYARMFTPTSTQPFQIKRDAANNALKIETNGELLLLASNYVNWGSTPGSGGYGLRDNGGAMEWKDNAGTWRGFSTLAPLTSPALAGTPTAPTATVGTNSTQIATTAFVQSALSNHTSGVYTPTLTGVTNVDATTAFECQYTRVGDVITVSGQFEVTTTTTGSTELGISLPVASDFTVAGQAGGTASDGNTTHCRLAADPTNNRLRVTFNATSPGAATYSFTVTYRLFFP